MRFFAMAAVSIASTLISMTPSPRWIGAKLLHGLDTLHAHYSASEAVDAKFVVAGQSVRFLAMTPCIPPAVATLTGLTIDEDNRSIIEKRLGKCTVGRMIDALATSSVGQKWLWSSSVRELVDNVVNGSSCPSEAPTSKRSTCGMGLSSCMEDCDGGLWFKPVPGACLLVCTMAEEHCTRCGKKRAVTYDLDLPQLSRSYLVSMLLAIAVFFYQSANHAQQIRDMCHQIDTKLATIKGEMRDLVAGTLETMEQLRRQQEAHIQLLETRARETENRDASSGVEEQKEGHAHDDAREANGDREQPRTEDTGSRGAQDVDVDVGGGDGEGNGVAQAAAGAEERGQEQAGLVGAAVGFVIGWARDRVGL